MNAPVQIRKPEVAERLRERARSEGMSITQLVEVMLAERIAAETARVSEDAERRRAAAETILARAKALPRREAWPVEGDFYDEDGFPR